MKAIVFLFINLIFLNPFANGQSHKKSGFIIEGTISGLAEGSNLYLVKFKGTDTIARSTVINEHFHFEGKVENGTEFYFLRLDSSKKKTSTQGFLLENSKIKIKGDFSSWPIVEVMGSSSQALMLEVMEIWKKELHDSTKVKLTKEFIAKHLNSLYIPYVIERFNTEQLPLAEKKEWYSRLKKQAKESFFGKQLDKYLRSATTWETIVPNATLPDFKVYEANGSKLSIREIASKSKYTLLDFWASWCGPCRKAIPELKRVYDNFRNRGFTILSIGVNDKPSDWQQAVAEDKTPWVNAFDQENIISEIIHLPAIPGYVLIDDQSRLIALECPFSEIAAFGPPLNGKKLYDTIDSLLSAKKSFIREAIQPLKVGDKMPDIKFHEILNYKASSAKISDFRGKLVILDFWFTGCGTCIELFPKMESLQRKFSEKVVILTVGFDAEKKGSIMKFVNQRLGKSNEMRLPTAVQGINDTLLRKLFPCHSMPHEVWIDSNGTVIGITDHRAVSEKNIQSILLGNRLPFKERKYPQFVSQSDPFLVNRTSSNDSFFIGSAMTGYIDNLEGLGWMQFVSDSTSRRYFDVNRTLYDYYKKAYSFFLKEINTISGEKRVIIESNKKPFYEDWNVTKTMDNWAYDAFCKKNLFCYEAIYPEKVSDDECYKMMIGDLDRFFGLKSTIAKRKVKCLILKCDRTKMVFSKFKFQKIEETRDTLFFKGMNVNYLVRQINDKTNRIVLNETGLNDLIDIGLPAGEMDEFKLRAFLRKYGFELSEEERELDMLILADR